MSDETPTPAPATAPSPTPIKPASPLTRESDAAVRPGFRSPANKASKAQKNKKR